MYLSLAYVYFESGIFFTDLGGFQVGMPPIIQSEHTIGWYSIFFIFNDG